MIIDAHVHLGRGGLIKASPQDLIRSMKRAKTDRAVIYAGEINELSTEEVISIAKKYKEYFIAVGSVSVVSPKKPGIKLVEKWLSEKLIHGLKFYPGYEYFYPNDPIVKPYLKLLSKYDFPAIFHTGFTYSKAKRARLKFVHPLLLDDVAVDNPDLKIIMSHFGDPWLTDAVAVLYKNKNVYADISGWSEDGKFTMEESNFYKNKLLEARTQLDSLNQIIFGSDWPLCDQASYLQFVRFLNLPIPERDKILFGNAKEIFHIV